MRAADRSYVEFPEGEERPRLMLDRLPEERVPFAALFSADSWILTRLTPARLEIIRKLRSCGTLAGACKRYWVRTERNVAVEWISSITSTSPNSCW